MCCLVIFVYWGNIPRTSHLECLKTAPRRQVAFLPPCLLHFCGLFLKKEKRNLALAVPVKKIKKVTAKHRLTPEQKFHSGSIFLASLFFCFFTAKVLLCSDVCGGGGTPTDQNQSGQVCLQGRFQRACKASRRPLHLFSKPPLCCSGVVAAAPGLRPAHPNARPNLQRGRSVSLAPISAASDCDL